MSRQSSNCTFSESQDHGAVPAPKVRGPGSVLFASWHLFRTSASESNVALHRILVGPQPDLAIHRSASDLLEQAEELRPDIDRLLHVATEEPYRDGMLGRAFDVVRSFLAKTSVAGVQVLTSRLLSRWMNDEVAADVVRMLGRAKHPVSLDDRRHLAERLLYSDSPLARDSAAVALADLEDPRGIEALEDAIAREQIPSLKADMRLALEDLVHYGVSTPES